MDILILKLNSSYRFFNDFLQIKELNLNIEIQILVENTLKFINIIGKYIENSPNFLEICK